MSQVIESGQIQRPTTYQDYSTERKAEVLALVQSNGGNIQQTSRETGIPHQTIRLWVGRPERFSSLQREKTAELDQKLDKTAHKLIDSISEHNLSEAPLSHKATAFGVVFDKLQLLRNLPTSITSDPVSAAADVCTMLKELCTNPEFREKVRESIQSRQAQVIDTGVVSGESRQD